MESQNHSLLVSPLNHIHFRFESKSINLAHFQQSQSQIEIQYYFLLKVDLGLSSTTNTFVPLVIDSWKYQGRMLLVPRRL
jgi:hypothetical protein